MTALEQASERLTEHLKDCQECRCSSQRVTLQMFELTWLANETAHLCPVAMEICRSIFE